MIYPTSTVADIRAKFVTLLKNGDFVEDKSGSKTVELVAANFIADEDFIFGTPSSDWHQRELQWYLSQSLNVNDIPPPIPKIWLMIADEEGFVNSNYGWCVFSKENGNQFDSIISCLEKNKDSRQAIMIYTRPTMHIEAGKDFMCCQTVQYLIRNNELITIVNFRSNDAIFGYKGDLYWNQYVRDKVYSRLQRITYPELIKGPIIWNATSLHVYERHFHLIRE